MNLQNRIEIRSIVKRAGVSQKTGRPYEIYTAQCIITDADGIEQVGRMNLSQALKDTQKGVYDCEYILGVDMDANIVPRIISMAPVVAKPVQVPKVG